MISAAAWRYGKQIFSLANTTPISLKSDYQIWITLLKKAGWRKTCRQHFAQHPWHNSLGSIGGGNHFAELQQIDQIIDAELFARAGLDAQHLQLLVHSGSRGLGQSILQRHIASFSHHGLPEGSDDALRYIAEHDDALAFARINRQLIALRIMQQVKATGSPVLDVAHNFVTASQIGDQHGWLHRKGATPDDNGLVIIPGSQW